MWIFKKEEGEREREEWQEWGSGGESKRVRVREREKERMKWRKEGRREAGGLWSKINLRNAGFGKDAYVSWLEDFWNV